MTTAPSHFGRAGRSTGRRFDVTTVLAVLLPPLTVGALLTVRPDAPAQDAAAPSRSALTRSIAICPSGAPQAALTSGGEAGGQVTYVLGDRDGSAEVVPGRLTTVRGGDGPFVVRAEGALAPGLVAARFDAPLAAAECRAPSPEQWFTGVGAGARHTSVLELVNPDAGPAVVDATVYGVGGVVDAPELRGVAVPGRGVLRLALAELVPRRDELALHVTTSRGRVGVSLRDRFQRLGTGGASEDWLPGQAGPATSSLLLGVAPGGGQRTLTLLNPGEDETRATVRLVTARSVFSPSGLEEVVIAPRSSARVSLSELLASPAARGALGVLVESPRPVTAALRSYVGGDVSHAAPGAPLASATTVLAPRGDKRLVLAGAARAGAVTVTARSAEGEVLGEQTVEVTAGRGFDVELPRRAALVTVSPRRTSVVGALLVTDGGRAAVIRLREAVTSGLIASVRPGL